MDATTGCNCTAVAAVIVVVVVVCSCSSNGNNSSSSSIVVVVAAVEEDHKQMGKVSSHSPTRFTTLCSASKLINRCSISYSHSFT